jgi:archaeoflavoprotein AfpA
MEKPETGESGQGGQKKVIRIAWGITGAGDRIRETIDIMKTVREKYPIEIRVFASKAGEQVLKWYKVYDEVKNSFDRFAVEVNANSPFLAGEVQIGKYAMLIIAPATSNTVAKIASGIADTLLSNAALMALKAFVPVYIMPSDYEEGEVITELPDGKKLRLRIRREDVEHVEKLRAVDGIHILEKPEDIEEAVKRTVQN